MRKTITIITVLAFVLAFSAAPVLAKPDQAKGPQEKATGEVYYNAVNLDRSIEFNAHEQSNDWTYYWHLVGELKVYYGGNTYLHDMAGYGASDGILMGSGACEAYGVEWTLSGSTDGDNITLVLDYDGSNYVATLTGTINEDGSMDGTWSSNTGQTGGTWETGAGVALVVPDFSGKGMLHYSDVNGDWYDVDIQYVRVESDTAFMAGPVVAASKPGWLSYWSNVAVFDGGEPAAGADKVWGIFTDEATAKFKVWHGILPGNAYTVDMGNLQVHTY